MKVFFLSFFLFLVLASLAAWWINPDAPPPGRTRLVWVTDGNPFRRQQIGLFNRDHPDLALTLDPGNLVMEKIIVQSLAGIGPDLFDVSGLYTLDGFVRAGIALDLTDLAQRYGFDPGRTWPKVADYIQIDGRQYAFPANVYANVLFYNKDLFDRHGVPYPPRDPTWEQFLDLGRKLTRRDPGGRGYECFGAMNLHWYELVLQAGGTLFSADGLSCTLDSPEAVEAFRFYDDLLHKDHIMPTPDDEAVMSGQGGWGAGYLNWFGTGRLAMIRISRWGLITFRQFPALRGKLGVCHLPHRRKKVVVVGAKLVAVNRYSPNIAQALKFMQYLTSEEFNRQVVRCADYLPPLPRYAQCDQFLHDPDHPEEDFNDVFLEAMDRAVIPEISPFIDPLACLQIVHRHLDLLAAGLKDADRACRDLTFEINRTIYHNLVKFSSFREKYHRITASHFDAADPQWDKFK